MELVQTRVNPWTQHTATAGDSDFCQGAVLSVAKSTMTPKSTYNISRSSAEIKSLRRSLSAPGRVSSDSRKSFKKVWELPFDELEISLAHMLVPIPLLCSAAAMEDVDADFLIKTFDQHTGLLTEDVLAMWNVRGVESARTKLATIIDYAVWP